MKVCSKCGDPKPNKDYNFKPGTTDGKHSQCKDCRNKDRRELRAKKAQTEAVKPTGTNPWDWQNYRPQINWLGNNKYVHTECKTQQYMQYRI